MGKEVYVCEALKALNNWCVWNLEKINGRDTKVPYDIVTGRKASTTDRRTWRSFGLVYDMLKTDCLPYNGLGLMISDGIVFVDVDHCIDEDGTISQVGQDVLSAFPDSYAEISQSCHGIHILTKGCIPRSFKNSKTGVEVYASGRYCAYTGNAIRAQAPTDEQSGIDYIFHKYATKQSCGKKARDFSLPECHSDSWIIRHASDISGQKGRNFQALFAGDTSAYPSPSEADSALCTLLAFWTDRNPEQINRLFRSSGLYRPKWEREDYRRKTINHACSHIPESLSEYQQRMRREKAKAIASE